MTADNVVGAVIPVLLVGYMRTTLLFPERF